MQLDRDQATLKVIFEFDLTPEDQAGLVPAIARVVRDVVSRQPGYVASALHASEDGQKIFNYFQWQSREVFDAFRANESAQSAVKPVIGRFAPKPRVYDVAWSLYGEGAARPSTVTAGAASPYTLFFEFDVEREEQQRAAPELESLVRDIVMKREGFLSAHLHLSTDGEKILLYFQWREENDFLRCRDSDEARRIIWPVISTYRPKTRGYRIPFVLGSGASG